MVLLPALIVPLASGQQGVGLPMTSDDTMSSTTRRCREAAPHSGAHGVVDLVDCHRASAITSSHQADNLVDGHVERRVRILPSKAGNTCPSQLPASWYWE